MTICITSSLVVLPFAILVGHRRLIAEIHAKKALSARKAEDWPTVIAEIDRAYSSVVTLDPMSTPLKWYRGEANYRRGDLSQALQDYENALTAHPYHVHTLNNLATCYEVMGNHDKAIHYYRNVIRISPQFAEAIGNLAVLQFNDGEYEKARETLVGSGLCKTNPTLERYRRIVDQALRDKEVPSPPEGHSSESSPTREASQTTSRKNPAAVHQLWSSAYGRLVYTIDPNELDRLLDFGNGTWAYEGIAWKAFARRDVPGLSPVYHFYSPTLKGHFYTISASEAERLGERNSTRWHYLGIAFYAFEEGQHPKGTSPVYRFWSATLGYHIFTAGKEETERLKTEYADVWNYEGTAWYAYR